MTDEAFHLCCCVLMMWSVLFPPRCKYSPSAYAGSGFWLNANSKRQAQHHVLPNCGRKPAPSSCEPTPRLPPELLPEDLWWAPSPGCPPKKEVRPVLGGQPHFGTEEILTLLHHTTSTAVWTRIEMSRDSFVKTSLTFFWPNNSSN